MIQNCQAHPLMIAAVGVPQNALSSGDPKHRRVRTRNPAFQSRLGQYPEVGSVVWSPNSSPMVHRSQQCLHLGHVLGSRCVADATAEEIC